MAALTEWVNLLDRARHIKTQKWILEQTGRGRTKKKIIKINKRKENKLAHEFRPSIGRNWLFSIFYEAALVRSNGLSVERELTDSQ